MSENKHTPGVLKGETNINDLGTKRPRCTLGIGDKVLFRTTFKNSRLNANRMMICWNSHDALLKACKALVIAFGEMSIVASQGKRDKAAKAITMGQAAIAEAEK